MTELDENLIKETLQHREDFRSSKALVVVLWVITARIVLGDDRISAIGLAVGL